jgi:hypothetical protein
MYRRNGTSPISTSFVRLQLFEIFNVFRFFKKCSITLGLDEMSWYDDVTAASLLVDINL